MSYVNPVWLEGRRRYWRRHDWQRFIRHDAHRFLTPAGIAEEKRAAEAEKAVRHETDAAAAAEHEDFEDELLHLRRTVKSLKLELELRRVQHKYSPDQPRVPKGNPDGGKWTKEGEGNAGKNGIDEGQSRATDISAARRRSGISEAECDAQYKRDAVICNLVHTPLCWQQAAARYAACLRGQPLPPLNF